MTGERFGSDTVLSLPDDLRRKISRRLKDAEDEACRLLKPHRHTLDCFAHDLEQNKILVGQRLAKLLKDVPPKAGAAS